MLDQIKKRILNLCVSVYLSQLYISCIIINSYYELSHRNKDILQGKTAYYGINDVLKFKSFCAGQDKMDNTKVYDTPIVEYK